MIEWSNAKIERTFMGIEDHGILAWGIAFSGVCWTQGSGLRFMCAESLPKIKAITEHFGPWEKLPGKYVRVGREGHNIVAMRDIIDDRKEIVF